jgi:hypothetical protein
MMSFSLCVYRSGAVESDDDRSCHWSSLDADVRSRILFKIDRIEITQNLRHFSLIGGWRCLCEFRERLDRTLQITYAPVQSRTSGWPIRDPCSLWTQIPQVVGSLWFDFAEYRQK